MVTTTPRIFSQTYSAEPTQRVSHKAYVMRVGIVRLFPARLRAMPFPTERARSVEMERRTLAHSQVQHLLKFTNPLFVIFVGAPPPKCPPFVFFRVNDQTNKSRFRSLSHCVHTTLLYFLPGLPNLPFIFRPRFPSDFASTCHFCASNTVHLDSSRK